MLTTNSLKQLLLLVPNLNNSWIMCFYFLLPIRSSTSSVFLSVHRCTAVCFCIPICSWVSGNCLLFVRRCVGSVNYAIRAGTLVAE